MTATERIKNVINWSGLKSNNQFALKIGYSSPGINKALAGNKTISYKLANAISNKFPEININWLLDGDGEMLKEEHKSEILINQGDGKDILSTQEIMSKLVITNERITSQNGDLIKILSEQTSIISSNSSTINNLSHKVNETVWGSKPKNVMGGAL